MNTLFFNMLPQNGFSGKLLKPFCRSCELGLTDLTCIKSQTPKNLFTTENVFLYML